MGADCSLRVILIGGTSHTGKSTLAAALASRLRWEQLSTDSLARHPGRPWKTRLREVPDHVAEHYLSLSVDELIEDVLAHYRRLWPEISRIVRARATGSAPGPLVLEGSALWPESVATLTLDRVAAIWLTADEDLLRARIYGSSGFADARPRERRMIRRLLDRSIRYDALMREAIRRRGLPLMSVDGSSSVEDLCTAILRIVGWAPPGVG